MILIPIAIVYLLINVFIVWRLIQFLGVVHAKLKHPVLRIITIVIYVLFAISPLWTFIFTENPLHRTLKQINNYWIGILAVTFVVVLCAEILRQILNHTIWKDNHPSEKRFKIAATLSVILVVLISLYGFIHPTKLSVVKENLDSNKTFILTSKTSEQNKLRVGLIADLHLGYSVGEEKMQQMVDELNKQDLDIVVLAGDAFDNEYDAIENPEKITKILANIKSTYGTYATLGNHDINESLLGGFSVSKSEDLENDTKFKDFLQKANVKLLEDESVLVDNVFYLVGRKDFSMSKKLEGKRESIFALTENLDKNKLILAIDHQPKELQEMSEAGVDFDLSGHTHNGQIFPGNLLLKLMWENPYGIEKKNDMYSCTTSGVGVWGPAMRIGTNSEIMVLEINSK